MIFLTFVNRPIPFTYIPPTGNERGRKPIAMYVIAGHSRRCVVLEADEAVMEDQSWLRPADDKRHINVAELDAVVKGLTLAVSWNVKELTVMTDS